MKNQIKGLYEQAKTINAGEAHLKLTPICDNPEATAVISVYIGERPANEILDDLMTWAEETNNEPVIEKIYELAELHPNSQ